MIPVNEPLLGDLELEYVMECVRTGWISSAGRFIEEFEEGWAAYCGRRYGIAVSSGTTALQMALAALDLEPGDEVIIPTFTIVSCAQAVVYNSATPVLVDSDPETWTMDVEGLEDRISKRTRAIMPVHIYGHPVDMDPVIALADKYGLSIIEDAAEAHGSEYLSHRGSGTATWVRCGSMGDMSAFSFYANKIVTTGEGGMVLTDDSSLAEKLRALRNLCFRSDKRFYHTELGFNFRLTNMQAALGVAQIGRINEIVEKKRWIAGYYTDRLRAIPWLRLPIERAWAKSTYWMYALLLKADSPLDAQSLARKLEDDGVETRPFFLGMHEQPALRNMGLFRDERYAVAERIAGSGLYLPSGLALGETQLERVCTSVTRAFD